ncbi:MAG: hypothetical protein V3W19_07110 [Desulfatiglandales bacterium]
MRCSLNGLEFRRQIGSVFLNILQDVGAADKAAIQLLRLRLSSAEVKSSRIRCSCRIRSDATSRGKVTNRAMRGVNGPAALELLSCSGGCNLGV